MAEKSFSVKEIQVQGSGTPTIESASGGDLNITAATTTFSGAVQASGAFTINSSSTIHVAESSDDNNSYNIPFLTATGGGGGGRKLQVDNGGIGFNPGTNTFFVQNIQSSSGGSTISSASSGYDTVINGFGGTTRGLGYFKFTTAGSSVSNLSIANVAIGYSAGDNTANPVTSSSSTGRNVFVGSYSGLENTAGQFNTFLGYSAGSDFKTGSQNVAIGFNAGDGQQSGSNNTYIGNGAAASSSNTGNEVVIGNTGVNKFKIPGINFILKDNGGTPTTGHVLTVDSSGEASFEIIPQEDGITSTSTISNLSSASDVMVGLSMGNRIHLEDDGSNANIKISTGETRNAGVINIKTGRLNSGTSPYLLGNGNNSPSGGSIIIGHTTGKVLIGSQSGNTNIGSSNGTTDYNGFLFNLDGTMETCSADGSSLINFKVKRRETGKVFSFQKTGGTEVGSIVLNVSENITVYAGTSDYRIKENDVKITNSITRLNQLRPIRFNFKENTSKTLDGFFAHEVQTVVPEAVIGTKDEVDSNNEPVLQGIDQSKLVPLLTAALQDAITEIETLKTRVAALEGS